ncbi:MAG: hexitol phosphatase HxpB [bacterium]|nr:hexitol phosphatase HxpB [bacterium]
MNNLQAIIFDMDGLLIDSEPLWFEAEKEVLHKVGIYLDEEMVKRTRGLRIDEVVDYWHKQNKWESPSKEEITNNILNTIIAMVLQKGKLLPGALDTIELAHNLVGKVCLASSSHIALISAVLKKFDLNSFDCVHSAESEIKGKPDPAVYLTTCKKINVDPKNCLALEDSVFGVQAAKSAGMKCIAIPAKEEWNDERFNIADLKLNSLEDVNEKLILNLFNK